MKRCQAMCIVEGSEGKRCECEALSVQTAGMWLCWVHGKSKEKFNRPREIMARNEAT